MSYRVGRYPSAWLPLLMSLAALGIVVGHLILFGTTRETDEGTAAHLFQLLIAGQVPIMAFFAIRWLARMPRYASSVIALQFLFVAAACAPVWYFHL